MAWLLYAAGFPISKHTTYTNQKNRRHVFFASGRTVESYNFVFYNKKKKKKKHTNKTIIQNY